MMFVASAVAVGVPYAPGALAQEAPAAAAAAEAGPERGFVPGDLFRLQGVTDPQISPDGKQVVYVRQAADIMTDRAVPSLWLVDVASGTQRPLVAGKGAHFAPRWSPDGARLAYISSDGEGAPQLHVLWMEGGADVAVTGLPDSPGSLAWSPDGSQIAYATRVPGEGLSLGSAPAGKPEGAQWAEPLEVIDKVTYRSDGGGYVKPGTAHVFVVPATGGAPRQLTFGNFADEGGLAWSGDGTRIFFTGNRKADWEVKPSDGEIYAVDVASGVVSAMTSRFGPDAGPLVSPDGQRIAYFGFDDALHSYTNTELYVMNADGSAKRSLTGAHDLSIDDAIWVGNSTLYVLYDEKGVRKVGKVGLDGSLKVLVEGLTQGGHFDRPYTGGSFSVSKGGRIAYTANGTDRPADLWVSSGGGKGERLTDLNGSWIDHKAMAPVRKLAVTAPDGRPVDAWLVTPPGLAPGEKAPLILEIHGGPMSAYSGTFSTDDQLYAAHGYAVLYTNPRGSTSYGEEFARLIDRNYPGPDYEDLMAAVDAAIADGVADPDNLFVTGGSGGGVLTAWIVGKTDRFKAAASQKPVIDWGSFTLTSDGAPVYHDHWFDKPVWEEPMVYWKRSPLSLVGNVRTPTLVVVGAEDYRTPVSESEQYYTALKIRGVPTALVKVPGASHGGIAARPSQSAAKASAILDWFDRYRTDTRSAQMPTPGAE
ncbi:alpha/beta hydrolase family protein [Novosphingobium decolorationis]|uniref:S9 family peptidase n=1 Tax=Novosphingobium decolorationis TaxID=2698673 RepID=A0ABX8EAB5_9SPHN|nr:S9 family peptidase [Novosphingobium decolorationis]QVM86079.1 S9 family peptidase [Novosphingobium decolorationis]